MLSQSHAALPQSPRCGLRSGHVKEGHIFAGWWRWGLVTAATKQCTPSSLTSMWFHRHIHTQIRIHPCISLSPYLYPLSPRDADMGCQLSRHPWNGASWPQIRTWAVCHPHPPMSVDIDRKDESWKLLPDAPLSPDRPVTSPLPFFFCVECCCFLSCSSYDIYICVRVNVCMCVTRVITTTRLLQTIPAVPLCFEPGPVYPHCVCMYVCMLI